MELSLPADLTENEINVKTTYVFIALGISETITGFLSGYLADFIAINILAVVASNMGLLALFTTLITFFI